MGSELQDTVALVARRGDRLESLAKAIGADGGSAHVILADITDPAQAESVGQQTVDTYGRLDILVNNAGVMLLGPIVDAPIAEWQRMIDLNLTALLRCTHAALPHLLDAAKSTSRGVADIVNISSVAGRVARMGSDRAHPARASVSAAHGDQRNVDPSHPARRVAICYACLTEGRIWTRIRTLEKRWSGS